MRKKKKNWKSIIISIPLLVSLILIFSFIPLAMIYSLQYCDPLKTKIFLILYVGSLVIIILYAVVEIILEKRQFR